MQLIARLVQDGDLVTLEDLGNLGELVGAGAVVVSLIYLAVQIRHNTKWVKTQTFESVVGRLIDWHANARDPDLTRVYLQGCERYDELSAEDQLRFGHLMTEILLVGELMVDTGEDLLKPTTVDGARRFILRLFETPGVRAWWSEGKLMFATDYQEYVERLVASEGRPLP